MRQPSLSLREQWRTNSVGLGALAIAGVVVLALAVWFRGPMMTGGGIAGFGPATGDYEYRLAHDALPLNGTREKLFVLERREKDSDTGASVNLLVVNSEDASSRWMFPDNGQTILRRDELHMNGNAGVYAPVTGLVITAAGSARESLYYYRVGGGPAVRFLTADSIVSTQQVGSDRYLVISRNGTRSAAAVYSLIDFRALAEKPLPEVPQ